MKNQRPEKSFRKIIYSSLCIFYMACLVYIFFFARRRWVPLPIREINIVPFRDKIGYLHDHNGNADLEFYKDLVGNILLFIPFPFLIYYVSGTRSFKKVLLLSASVSVIVEAIQYIFRIGVADIDDLVLNVMGAFLGLSIMYWLQLKNRAVFTMQEMVAGKRRQ